MYVLLICINVHTYTLKFITFFFTAKYVRICKYYISLHKTMASEIRFNPCKYCRNKMSAEFYTRVYFTLIHKNGTNAQCKYICIYICIHEFHMKSSIAL